MAPRSNYQKPSGQRGTQVDVYDNNISQALRRLKKILQSEGVFREMRERTFFEKPSMVRKKAKAAARKRLQKDLAKRQE
jgi:small subunit ribosomal protein S21